MDSIRTISANGKKILSLIVQHGPLTKRQLAERGGIGWATAVKFVNRLDSVEVLTRIGTSDREIVSGKNSYVYDLGRRAPVFLGLDIEYRTTRFALTNLRNEILWSSRAETPRVSSLDEIEGFVARLVSEANQATASNGFGPLDGIGIGMPTWLTEEGATIFDALGGRLSARFDLPTRVENNIRAYTLYKEHTTLQQSFVVVSVRNGIGAGYVVNGELLRGEQGLAGEIGHITIPGNTTRCRCGKSGCIETVVNEHALTQEYAVRRGDAVSANRADSAFSTLFRDAAEGSEVAVGLLSESAELLGQAIATLVLVLNVRNVFVVGQFGADGDVWVPFLEESIRKHVEPRTEFALHYRELDDSGYLIGAALLVAREYLDYSVMESPATAW